jgi:SET domain-containing protein
MKAESGKRPPLYRVRQSKIHGRGVFAARRIRKGTRIIEYVGERVTHAEADRRYEDRPATRPASSTTPVTRTARR